MTRKRLVTKTSIKKLLSDCAFDPNRSLFKVAVENSDGQYCMTRAQEYIEEAKLTLEKTTLIQAIRSLTLAVAFLERDNAAQESEES